MSFPLPLPAVFCPKGFFPKNRGRGRKQIPLTLPLHFCYTPNEISGMFGTVKRMDRGVGFLPSAAGWNSINLFKIRQSLKEGILKDQIAMPGGYRPSAVKI
jgi:hypothetical protein